MQILSDALNGEMSILVVLPLALAMITVIVFVHELGHFLFARRFGVHVKEFAVGFPPRLWSRLRGGVVEEVHALSALTGPIEGPLRTAKDLHGTDRLPKGAVLLLNGKDPRFEFHAGEAGRSTAVAVLIDGKPPDHCLAHLRSLEQPVLLTNNVSSVFDNQNWSVSDVIARIDPVNGTGEPNLASVTIGATRFAINAIPIGGYVRLAGENERFDSPESFASQSAWKRAIILLAGPAMNLMLVPVLFIIAALIWDINGSSIVAVAPGGPAQVAGLRAEDRLLRIGDSNIDSVAAVQAAVRKSVGRKTQVLVQRGTENFSVTMIPRTNPPESEGALGIQIKPDFGPGSVVTALSRAVPRSLYALILLPVAIGEAISGAQDLELAGPVGIVQTVGEAARQGPEVVFILAAFLTAQIGLLNLMPWPGLDGGRLIFVAIEIITGRRVPPHREVAFHLAGIMLLLILVVAITVGDLQRLGSN